MTSMIMETIMVKKILGLFTTLSESKKNSNRSTICPPPGATNITTIFIFCFYTDSEGKSGWCVIR